VSPRRASTVQPTLGGVAPPTVVLDEAPPLSIPDTQVIALPVLPADESTEGPWIGPGGAEVCETYDIDLLTLLDRNKATGRAGEVVTTPILRSDTSVEQVILIGVGMGSASDYRRAGAALARSTRQPDRLATTITTTADDHGLTAFVEGVILASYGFSRKTDTPPRAVGTVVLAGTRPDRQRVLDRAVAVARAGWVARDLAQTPSNEKNPPWLATQAEQLAKSQRLAVSVRDERALAKEGFGGLLAVGQGSATPPRLIELTYHPDAPAGTSHVVPHVVLVGKGITFDSGGLSIKPHEAMIPMKTDMTGGGVVMAVLSEAAALNVRVKVTGLIAAAENAVSGSAQRPGDVIRQYDGTTVEVRNTDAEGRLVLADALGYAAATLAPDVIVDIATLTGAAARGLGRRHAALYATDETLAEVLEAAGEAAGEHLWRMPLVDEYRAALDTPIADVCHVETTKMGGGSITAALFLERFTRGIPWAHLDIAGPARAEGDEHEITKGGTGFGARLLLYWLASDHPLTGVSTRSTWERRRNVTVV
jgi:leucyl aminopeptidase